LRNLINFILRSVHWLLFFLLLVISGVLLVQNNQFQRSRYLSPFREASGRIHSALNSLSAYVDLRRSNTELLDRLVRTQIELDYYKNKYFEAELDSGLPRFSPEKENLKINYIPAFVVNNQINGIENYITINKGSNDGVKPDMGVVSMQGIAGVVFSVSPNFSRVIPLLNPDFRPNCKIKHRNYFGPMIWDGKDSRYSYLEELPRHSVYELGDTILTSGYSAIFPEGIPVGIVAGSRKDKQGDNTSLKVKLFTDFTNLRELMIVDNRSKEEQELLEKGGGE